MIYPRRGVMVGTRTSDYSNQTALLLVSFLTAASKEHLIR